MFFLIKYPVKWLLVLSTLVLSVGVTAPNKPTFPIAAVPLTADHDCLSVTKWFTESLLDTTNGRYKETPSYAQQVLAIAPNGKYTAILDHEPPAPDTVKIKSTGSEDILMAVPSVEGVETLWTSWSADSQYFVYFAGSRDSEQIILVDILHRSVRTVSVPQASAANDVGGIISQGWSADGLYFAVERWEKYASGTYWRLFFVSVADLRIFTPPDLGELISQQSGAIDLIWSPQGHQLAMVNQDSTGWALILSSPDRAEVVKVPLEVSPGNNPSVSWSPDGRYLAVHDSKLVQIFYPDGTLQGRVNGRFLLAADQMSFILTQRDDPPVDLTRTPINLTAFYVDDHHVETVAPDLVFTDTVHFYDNNLFFAPALRRLLLPVQRDGKYAVDIADYDGHNRFTLIESAEWVAPVDSSSAKLAWSSDRTAVAIVWEDTKQDSHLTWTQADGSHRHELDLGLDPVYFLQWVDRYLFLGLAGEDGTYRLEMADVETAARHSLLTNAAANQVTPGQIVFSPDRQRIAIRMDGTPAPLVLVAADGQWVRNIGRFVWGGPAWSPDSQRVAYTTVEHDSRQSPVVVYSYFQDGSLDHAWQVGLPGGVPKAFDILRPWLSWSRCQVTPEEAQPFPTSQPLPTMAQPVSLQSPYACLRYDGYYSTDTVVNLRTGIIQDRQPKPMATPIEPVEQRLISPDGKAILIRAIC